MSLSLDRLRALTRSGMGGLDEGDISDDEVDELLNLSLWDVEDKFPFETKEKVFSTVLVGSQLTYDLTSMPRLDAISSVVVFTSEGQSTKLSRTTRGWYDENYVNREDNEGFPVKYFREGCKLRLWPTPSVNEDGLSLRVTVRQSLASLVEGEVDTTGLPRNWDEIVLYGAISKGLLIYRNDLAKHREILNYQLGLIRSTVTTESKEEEDSRYAGVEVLTEWPNEQ